MAKEKLDSFFGETTQLKGELRFTGVLRMDGQFEGTIHSPDTLIVGKTANVTANLETGSLYNMGQLTGNVIAKNFISIHAESSLVGDVNTPVMVSEENAFFFGRCTMPKRERVPNQSFSDLGPRLLVTRPATSQVPILISEDLREESSPFQLKRPHLMAGVILLGFVVLAGIIYGFFSGSDKTPETPSVAVAALPKESAEAPPENAALKGENGTTESASAEKENSQTVPEDSSSEQNPSELPAAQDEAAAPSGAESSAEAPERKSFIMAAVDSVVGLFSSGDKSSTENKDLAQQVFSDDAKSEGIDLVDLGNGYVKQGDYKNAQAVFEKVLQTDPDNLDIRIKLVDARLKSGNVEQAFAEYEDRKDPATQKTLSKVIQKLVSTYKEQGDQENLMVVLEQKALANPEDQNELSDLADLYVKKGEVDKAISLYKGFIKIQPKEASHHFELGRLYSRQDRLDDAVSEFKEALALDPSHAKSHLELGLALEKFGKTEEAKEEYTKLADIDPKNPEALNNEAFKWIDQNRLRQANRNFDQVLAKDPENLRALYGIATIYAKRDQAGNVENQCQTILNIDKNFTPAMNRLAWIYARQGKNLKEAEELSLKSMKYNAEIPEYLDTLSEIYYQMQDYEKAIELIKQAVDLRPDDPYFKRQLQKFQSASKEAGTGPSSTADAGSLPE